MNIKIPHHTRLPLVLLFFIFSFIPLLLNNVSGADFPRYFSWAIAFNQNNIFRVAGDTLSPYGVPLSHLSFGPGLIFSLGSPFSVIKLEDAVFVGWLFTIIFWMTYAGILLRLTNNNQVLTLFGICITFLGTPIGYYSSAYASESLSYTCLSVAIFWILRRNRFNYFDYLTTGIWSALLILIRSQLALYLLPIQLVIAHRAWNDSSSTKTPLLQTVFRELTFLAPIIMTLLSITTVNTWMTGHPLKSVYDFGFGEFKSLNFLQPELLAVLTHPWHGLFVYHPLYLPCFVLLIVMVCQQKHLTSQLLLLSCIIVILLHYYLHASWYAWWLGLTTFGMRGLSICGVILIPVLINFMSKREEQRTSNTLLIITILSATLWSFTLLTQGPTQYYTYNTLLSGINSAVHNLIDINFMILPASVFIILSVAAHKYLKITFMYTLTIFLMFIMVQYQIIQLVYDKYGMIVVSTATLIITTIMMFGYPVVIGVFNKYSVIIKQSFISLTIIVFIILASAFAKLVISTNKILATKRPSPIIATPKNTVDIVEIRTSLHEYLSVPNFDDKKAQLTDYLAYLEHLSQ